MVLYEHRCWRCGYTWKSRVCSTHCPKCGAVLSEPGGKDDGQAGGS